MAVMEPKASPQTQPEWRLSAKAVDLLQCFMSGLDDIVLRIARGIAEERQKATNAKELRVEAEDVAAASRHVFAQILSQSDLSDSVRSDLVAMQECLTAKCQPTP